jgi:hypothetical protein
MEKAGRWRLASAAPPLGWLRRRESGAGEDGLGARVACSALVRSGPDDAPRLGASRPGSSSGRWTSVRRCAWLPKIRHQLHTEPSGGTRLERWADGSAQRPQVT